MIIEGYKLKAEGNNWITQKPEPQFFVTRLSMGCHQTVDDFQEVSNEFKEQWESEHQPKDPEEESEVNND